MAWSDVSDDDKLRCAMLWELVWPSGETTDTTARLEKMEERYNAHCDHFVHLASARWLVSPRVRCVIPTLRPD